MLSARSFTPQNPNPDNYLFPSSLLKKLNLPFLDQEYGSVTITISMEYCSYASSHKQTQSSFTTSRVSASVQMLTSAIVETDNSH